MAEIAFIHGAGDSAAIWEHQLAAFGPPAAAHRVLALDLPGHGARQAERAHTDHTANAAEVERALQAAGMEHVVLVGHSMGGAVALTYALGGPDGTAPPARLRALVLVASGARLRMHPDFLAAARARAEATPEAVIAQLPEPAVPLERCLAPGASPALVAWLRAHSGQATAQALYADFLANNAFDVMDRLGAIRVPTLVIGGAEDTMTPPRFLQYLAEHIPGAQLVLLPGVGHYPMAEQPEAFNQHLAAFLAALP
jgi:pimeloyl-ACP methyl ester carboxylesterase